MIHRRNVLAGAAAGAAVLAMGPAAQALVSPEARHPFLDLHRGQLSHIIEFLEKVHKRGRMMTGFSLSGARARDGKMQVKVDHHWITKQGSSNRESPVLTAAEYAETNPATQWSGIAWNLVMFGPEFPTAACVTISLDDNTMWWQDDFDRNKPFDTYLPFVR